MNEEKIIDFLENEIGMLEGLKFHLGKRIDDTVERLKQFRFKLKYGDEKEGEQK